MRAEFAAARATLSFSDSLLHPDLQSEYREGCIFFHILTKSTKDFVNTKVRRIFRPLNFHNDF